MELDSVAKLDDGEEADWLSVVQEDRRLCQTELFQELNPLSKLIPRSAGRGCGFTHAADEGIGQPAHIALLGRDQFQAARQHEVDNIVNIGLTVNIELT